MSLVAAPLAQPAAPLRRLWRGFWGPMPFLPRLGLVVVAAMLLLAALGPWLAPQDPNDFSLDMNVAPSAAHWLGTDDQGQDILSRLLVATRLSFGIGAFSALLSLALGGLMALIAIAWGRISDILVFGLVDLIRALPGILLALALVVALEPGTGSVVLALAISYSPHFALIARATYRLEMTKPYVAAAIVFGAGPVRIALRHVLPNIIGAMVTQFAIVLPRCIVTESVLSYLGLGASPEYPTWGRMIAAAAAFTEEAPHALLAPIAALCLLTFGLAMLGDELRRRIDPARRRLSL